MKPTLDDFQKAFSQEIETFDAIIVGDGSGSTLDKPSGWAAVIWAKNNDFFKVLTGCSNFGTNNYAEIMPLLNALSYINAAKLIPGPSNKVLFVSDSELIIKQGQKLYTVGYQLAAFWQAIRYYEQIYNITYKHVLRNTNAINTYCDVTSKKNRKEQ